MRAVNAVAVSITAAGVAAALLCAPLLSASAQGAASWSAVETALGRKGAMQPGQVIKFAFPRSDLSVTLDGVTLKPALALGGWLAFKEISPGQAMAMGDLVLTESEVGPVMLALQNGGVGRRRCTTTSSAKIPMYSTCTSRREAMR